jgi:hypothetical protein
MDPAGIPALVDAIRHMHGVEAKHVETTAVHEKAPTGETVWKPWHHRVLDEALRRLIDSSLSTQDRDAAYGVARAILNSQKRGKWSLRAWRAALGRLLEQPGEDNFLPLHMLRDLVPLLESDTRAAEVYAALIRRTVRQADKRFLLGDLVSGWLSVRASDFATDPRLAQLDADAAAVLGCAPRDLSVC